MWAKSVLNGAERVFIGVDIDLIDKMAPRGVKSAPGAIELNQHFGAEKDLLNLQCMSVSGYCSHWNILPVGGWLS